MVFFLKKGLNLLLVSVSKSNVWQYINCVLKGNLIDFEIETNSVFIKGLNLLVIYFIIRVRFGSLSL